MNVLQNIPECNGKTGWPWTEESTLNSDTATNWPKITIVTPSFNQGRYIEETIRSVLLQNYPNLEYIIIDGGSCDATVEILKKYNSWIDYWVSEPDEGQSHAINKGFRKATGEIINWLNSDDLLERNSLYHIALAFIDNPEYSFVYGQCQEFDNQGIIPFKHYPTDKLPLRYYYEFPYGQPSCFYKKKCLDEVGYIDERFNFTMDFDLFLRIALKYKMLQIDSVLSRYRWHDKTKTNTIGKIGAKEQITVIINLFKTIQFKNGCDLLYGFRFYPEFDKQYLSDMFVIEHKFQILFEFLITHIEKWYIAGDFKKVRQFISFLKKNKPELLNDKRLSRKLFMLKFPDFVIKLYQRSKKLL
jgi:glycosyltransferase involved in cell wall biosynthesis